MPSSEDRVCPVCGDFRFGSVQNDDGTWTRHCNGSIVADENGLKLNLTMPRKTLNAIVFNEAKRSAIDPTVKFSFKLTPCPHRWHQSEDDKNGVFARSWEDEES